MKQHTSVALALSILAGMVLPAMANTVSVPVPSPVTGDPVSTGITVKAGKTYVIRANITIVPAIYKDQPVIDPIYVVQASGGMPLATLDGTPIYDSMTEGSFSPVQNISLTYVPAESGGLYLRLLPTSTGITFNSLSVDVPTINPPTVKVKTKKLLPNGRLTLKGSASGDDAIEKVLVVVNGKSSKAKGTESWSFAAKLKPGKNKVTVTAFDAGGQSSHVTRLTFTVKK